MTQKNEDFKFLVEQACSTFRLSHRAVKEKFKGFPVCYMQHINTDTNSDSVEVSIDRIGASITCYIDENGLCSGSSIYFYEANDRDSFIYYLISETKYCYKKKAWILDESFHIELEEQINGLHYYCCNMDNEILKKEESEYIDFSWLIKQMQSQFGKTYVEVLDRYGANPICLIECIDFDNYIECIRVDFCHEQGTSITYFFNENRELTLTSLCVPEISHVDLVVTLLHQLADYYDNLKNQWVIQKHFLVIVDQDDCCTHFLCCKLVNC